MNFEEKVCVVTGASSGIGRSLALAFARSGARVSALGRDPERLASLAGELEGDANKIVPYQADFERDGEVESVARKIRAKHDDRVDILVHSAGAIVRGPVEDAQVGDLDRLYRVIVRGPFVLTQALLPALRSAAGQIVFINSLVPHQGANDAVMYAAMKQAVRAVADGLRQEVNADGIRVVTVAPGRTDTPMQQWVHEYEHRPYEPERLLHPEDVVEVVIAALSIGPRGEVTDVSLRPVVNFGAK